MKKGWQTKSLGEVAEVYDGPHATPKTVGTGPIFLGISALRDGVIDLNETRHVTEEDFRQWTRRVKPQPNDVVFSYETRLGQAAIIPEGLECCLGRRMGLVRFDEDQVVPRFFLYQYLSPPFSDYLDSKTVRGATVDRISIKEFPSFQILVPPIPEQHRIVGILDEAFDGLATATSNAEQNLRNARALFESHVQSVFTKRGKGWVEKRLEEVLAVQPQNGWSPPAANHANSGTPVLTLSAVTGFVFRPDKIKFTSAVTDSRARYWVQNGDLLITRSNTPELVGHVAIASGIEEPTIYPDLIMQMNPDPTNALTEFLYYQMRSPALREEISSRAQGANPTMKKISNGAVRTLPICVPAIPEQRRVVAQLDTLASETQYLESIYRQKLAALEALKKSLLYQAFSGEL
ncbi:MAG: restriction endonuclease subunit S [Nitrospira sp.]|nr:restriction endonuclease subunit S [Nitrospira sp.]MDR4470349.1 restriction endonuclease subunit S [Nitrospira sp.]